MNKKKKTLQKKKRLPKNLTIRKRAKTGRGKEHEVPFLLKQKLEDMGMYEPGIVQNIMSDVPKHSTKRAITMADYRKWHKENEIRKQKIRTDNLEIMRKSKKEIKELEDRLLKIDRLRQDGPARRTRGSKHSESQQKWAEDTAKMKARIEELFRLNYRLSIINQL